MRPIEYEEAVAAARWWLEEHGRLPIQQEWEKATREHPSARTIRRRWSWERVMSDAAGRSAEESAIGARRRELLLALRKAREELGRWPGGREWEHRTKTHVTRRTYVRWFGSVRHEALCPPGGGGRPPPSSCRSSLRKLRAA